jgi:hypothetical protein
VKYNALASAPPPDKKAARHDSPEGMLYAPGNPATLSSESGLRPEALRPALSGGLPFSSKNLWYS